MMMFYLVSPALLFERYLLPLQEKIDKYLASCRRSTSSREDLDDPEDDELDVEIKDDLDDFNRWLDEQNASSAAVPQTDSSSNPAPVEDASTKAATKDEPPANKGSSVDEL